MIECESEVKKWGNSFGIVLPKDVVRANNINVDDTVKVIITKTAHMNVAKKLWGSLPKWKTPSEELEKWVDKEFDLP